jgi:hypothetical protein
MGKNTFTAEDEKKLLELVGRYGSSDWEEIAREMQPWTGLQLCQRWNNYVNPNSKSCPWTPQEDDLLKTKYVEFGGNWKMLVSLFPNHSKNNIKTHYVALNRRHARASAEIEPTSAASSLG